MESYNPPVSKGEYVGHLQLRTLFFSNDRLTLILVRQTVAFIMVTIVSWNLLRVEVPSSTRQALNIDSHVDDRNINY